MTQIKTYYQIQKELENMRTDNQTALNVYSEFGKYEYFLCTEIIKVFDKVDNLFKRLIDLEEDYEKNNVKKINKLLDKIYSETDVERLKNIGKISRGFENMQAIFYILCWYYDGFRGLKAKILEKNWDGINDWKF